MAEQIPMTDTSLSGTGEAEVIVIILAVVAALAIAGLVVIILKMLADGREQMRLLAPQIRIAAPPKEPQQPDEEMLDRIAGAMRASGVAAIGHQVIEQQQGEAS